MKMSTPGTIISILTFLVVSLTTPLNAAQPRASCTVTSYDQIADAVASCSDIVIQGIEVPGGQTLELDLKDGTKVTFAGEIKFGFENWAGPLVTVRGKGVTVQGQEGHKLNGQGELYWDGLGGNGGKTKPIFFRIKTTGGSVFSNINILNCPERCINIRSTDLTLSGWNVDCSAGDTQGGHNTDGFGITNSQNIVIKDTVVKNQDDCIAVNQGANMHFSNMHCTGSHGLSLSVGMSKTSYDGNVVTNVTFTDSVVENAANAIHIKTHADGTTGAIKDVTYKNIEFSGITNYGINIQEDYANGGSTGTAVGNVPITNLKMINIHGTLSGDKSMNVFIFCGTDGCSDWSWSDISISGGKNSNSCNFSPSGFDC